MEKKFLQQRLQDEERREALYQPKIEALKSDEEREKTSQKGKLHATPECYRTTGG